MTKKPKPQDDMATAPPAAPVTKPARTKKKRGRASAKDVRLPNVGARKVKGRVIKPEQAERFFEGLRLAYSIQASLERSGIGRATAYRLRASDKKFAEAWEAAYDAGTDRLEDAAILRAYSGHERPIFQKGVQVGAERVYSDRLMEVMLRARRPNKYRERVDVTHQGKKDGIPIAFRDVSLKDLSNEQLDDLKARLLARGRERAALASPGRTGNAGESGS